MTAVLATRINGRAVIASDSRFSAGDIFKDSALCGKFLPCGEGAIVAFSGGLRESQIASATIMKNKNLAEVNSYSDALIFAEAMHESLVSCGLDPYSTAQRSRSDIEIIIGRLGNLWLMDDYMSIHEVDDGDDCAIGVAMPTLAAHKAITQYEKPSEKTLTRAIEITGQFYSSVGGRVVIRRH